ncbi:hypothetical protein B0H13DRAFT_1889025 [Mycena leptocephala]|nr:hypothetical protein B0H13DRAFT_1889025 [Mycena leptocephala]
MGRRKRERARIPKEARKNLRLWAEGARESILKPHLEEYALALDKGWHNERRYLKKVCNEFHARVDWRLADHDEPELKDYDPKAVLLPETLDDAEEVAKRQRVKELNARIRRWFNYRIRKAQKHNHSAGFDPTKDPYAVLLAKLSGLQSPPKARQAYQQFMHESYAEKIAPIVAERWAKKLEDDAGNPDRTKEPKAGFRAQVAREVFAELPKSEQDNIAGRAKDEAATRRKAYQDALKTPASKAPSERQNLPEFVGPLLRGIQEYTGMHSVLIVGGPVPKFSGELRTIHVAYGRNHSAGSYTWPQWDKERFSEQVLDFMTEFLATAFTPQECAAAALAPVAGLTGAQYTMPKEDDDDHSGSESDSDSDSFLESELELSSGEEDAEEDSRVRKKRKVDARSKSNAKAAENPTSIDTTASLPVPAAPAIWSNADGQTLDKVREANIARHRALAEQLKQQFQEKYPDLQRPVPKKRGRKPKEPTAGPTRKSTRLGGDSAADDMRMDVDPDVVAVEGAAMHDGVAGDASSPAAPLSMTQPSSDGDLMAQLSNTSVSPITSSDHASTPTTATTTTSTPVPAGGTMGPTVPPPPQCPTKAAPWFIHAHEQVTKEHLGCHFNAVLAAWIRVEAASKYESGPTTLGKTGRPEIITTWISRLRGKRTCDTSIADPAAYAVTWQNWWDTLQPKWRKKDTDGAWSMTGGYGPNGNEWGPLYQWGVNGTLSLVASLFFWGCAVCQSDGEMYGLWEKAVLDVGWMLEGLAIYYEKFNRRF